MSHYFCFCDSYYYTQVLLFLLESVYLFCGLRVIHLHLCLYGFYLPLEYIKIYINFIQVLLWFHLFYFKSLIHLEFILVSILLSIYFFKTI